MKNSCAVIGRVELVYSRVHLAIADPCEDQHIEELNLRLT